MPVLVPIALAVSAAAQVAAPMLAHHRQQTASHDYNIAKAKQEAAAAKTAAVKKVQEIKQLTLDKIDVKSPEWNDFYNYTIKNPTNVAGAQQKSSAAVAAYTTRINTQTKKSTTTNQNTNVSTTAVNTSASAEQIDNSITSSGLKLRLATLQNQINSVFNPNKKAKPNYELYAGLAAAIGIGLLLTKKRSK